MKTMTICANCKYFSTGTKYFHRCMSPKLERQPILDYVTGRATTYEGKGGIVYGNQYPLCYLVNTKGKCKHYKAK